MINKSETMRLFHPVNNLVSRNPCLILLNKILLFLNLVKHTSKIKDYKFVLIFSLALVVAEFKVEVISVTFH
jgi:hypothetical protein